MQSTISFPRRAAAAASRGEAFLKSWGGLCVAIFACFYYASYYRSGLNLGGEGGTVAVIAMRLMEGQRPIVDTFLGYNVMWFYPVAWLFELTGPNYIALRIYFFVLCTLTGVLAFYIVRRVSGRGWFATLVALGPVLIPGMMFRNYMGFLAMLNMFVLLEAFVYEQPNRAVRAAWIAAAGAALALTFLIRIDLGAFFCAILLGLLILFPLTGFGGWRRRLGCAAAGLLLIAVVFSGLHAPFVLDAQRRGFGSEFIAQYTGWINMVRYLAQEKLAALRPASPPPPVRASNSLSPAATPQPVFLSPNPSATPPPFTLQTRLHGVTLKPRPAPAERDLGTEEFLAKRSLGNVLAAGTLTERIFALVTYLPILVAVLIVLPMSGVFLMALARLDPALGKQSLAALVCAGSALTLFPQFFYFRPDTPHLSEFMVPFMVATACAAWVACMWARKGFPAKLFAVAVTATVAALWALYFSHAFPKDSAGTIAARWRRTHEFAGANGVRVRLKRPEQEALQGLYKVLSTHTKPGDYVVCYPYSPTVNFLADRPSYEHNLYIDNAHNISQFHGDTLAEISKFRPAAIVVDNRKINQTEESRFSNWAATTYEWIREHYRHAGTFRRQEVYLRPDLYPNERP